MEKLIREIVDLKNLLESDYALDSFNPLHTLFEKITELENMMDRITIQIKPEKQ